MILFAKTKFAYDKPETGYGSYVDYWRLVELSGFPICYIDEIDPASDNTYIFSPRNGEVGEGWPGARAKIIHWNLEQDAYPPLAGVYETWASDKALADKTGARYVPMGSHPELATFGDAVPLDYAERQFKYMAIMLAYMTPRRNTIGEQFNAHQLKLAPNAWGLDRHHLLSTSAAMLHVHQNEGKNYVAPQRFALAAAYGLPLITETLAAPGIFSPSVILQCAYEHLPRFSQVWLKASEVNRFIDFGYALHRLLCYNWTFRRGVEDAL